MWYPERLGANVIITIIFTLLYFTLLYFTLLYFTTTITVIVVIEWGGASTVPRKIQHLHRFHVISST